jgi:hypothetical protein
MTTYRITSDNTTLGAKGATVDAAALDGLSIDALVSGGHIEPISAPTKKPNKTEQD